jgi:hypothetical protein
MTRRTRRLLLFGLPTAVVVVLLAVWLLWPRSALTRENAAKIREGMTRAEVEALLGGPARNESTGLTNPDIRTPDAAEHSRVETQMAERMLEVAAGGTVWGWTSDRVAVHVRFDEAGRVSVVEVFPLRRAAEDPLDRLCRWLGL